MEPLILYSIQSFLAYHINKQFYNNRHFVWCAPCFDSNQLAHTEPRQAPTSNPKTIFNAFIRDVYTIDNHYRRNTILDNTKGLLIDNDKKLESGVITNNEHIEIKRLIKIIKKIEIFTFTDH